MRGERRGREGGPDEWEREREKGREGVVKQRAELARRKRGERSSSLDDEEEGGVRAAAASNKGERGGNEGATH